MTDYSNIQQFYIGDDGKLEAERPVTWDGEPMYSPSTVQEGLFAADAFEQMPGQMLLVDGEETGNGLYVPADDLPPRWLDELDPELREYAEEFEL